MLKIKRSYIAASHDIVMAVVSFLAALYLRLGAEFDIQDINITLGAVIFTSVCAITFSAMQLYRGIWRYASVPDMVAITKAVTFAILIFLPVMFVVTRLDGLPRSVLFINWLLLIALLGGPRFIYRVIKDKKLHIDFNSSAIDKRIPVLLAGVNDGTSLFLRHAANKEDSDYRVVGILAKDDYQKGRNIHGIRVYGTFLEARKVIDKLCAKGKAPQKIVLSLDGKESETIKLFLQICDETGLTLAQLPKLSELKNNDNSQNVRIQPILPEDLLGRNQVVLDIHSMQRFVTDKTVMVTGCGGTIGSEIVRQLLSYQPKQIILFELSELHLYQVTQQLEQLRTEIPYIALIGDVRNRQRVMQLVQKYQPDIIFHAAAIKHVPIAENNVAEAVLTNTVGSKNVADACVEYQVGHMVMISTDKAVNPTSIMGLTKRVAELYCQSLASFHSNTSTNFTTVRFGNVLGSSGSVVPLFHKQLENGGPLTVTHPDMTRYFMTVKEAVSLVIQSAAMDQPNESRSSVYVLDMGEPVKIVDLAKQMIQMAGLKLDEDIAITYTGLRAGEKLYEELFYDSENLKDTEFGSIMLASPDVIEYKAISVSIEALAYHAASNNREGLIRILNKIVPEYQGNLSDSMPASVVADEANERKILETA